MIEQGFYISKEIPQRWWVMVFYNIDTNIHYDRILGTLLAAGLFRQNAIRAVNVLSKPNTGYIHSDLDRLTSVVMISHGTSYDEVFDTVTHEIEHLTMAICERFGINPHSEKAAYIQGEIGKQMYKGVALSVCPKCGCGENKSLPQ